MNPAEIISHLETNAALFSAALADWTDEEARWRPAPGSWSLIEVVNHLADEEIEDFRTRVRLTLEAPRDHWPPIDPEGWVEARAYAKRGLSESRDRFVTARHESMAWLQGLKNADWSSEHEHPGIGVVSALEMLEAWLAHDALHLRQVARLRVELLRSMLSGKAMKYAGE